MKAWLPSAWELLIFAVALLAIYLLNGCTKIYVYPSMPPPMPFPPFNEPTGERYSPDGGILKEHENYAMLRIRQ